MDNLELVYELTFGEPVPVLPDGDFSEKQIFYAIVRKKPLTSEDYYKKELYEKDDFDEDSEEDFE